jgi:hypothetical protein
VYVAQGRVQDDEGSTLIAFMDGKEVARSQTAELRLPVKAGSELTVRLEDGTGALMGTRSVTAPSGAGLTVFAFAAAVIALLLGGVFTVRKRRRASTKRETRKLLTTRRRTLLGQTPAVPAERGVLVVRGPDGTERHYPIGPRPLSLGRAQTCDVVIDSKEVWELHARVSALPGGEFQVHGIAPALGFTGDGNSHDEWTVVQPGEQLAIGGHVLTVLARGEASGSR